jgi:hypothetical protein
MGISCITLGLWVWVLAETIIFLVIVQDVQTQNRMMEASLDTLRKHDHQHWSTY